MTFDISQKFLGPVHLHPKTDKWDYLWSPIMKKKINSCFDIGEVPRSLGGRIGTGSIFCFHFHFQTGWPVFAPFFKNQKINVNMIKAWHAMYVLCTYYCAWYHANTMLLRSFSLDFSHDLSCWFISRKIRPHGGSTSTKS